MPINSPLSKLPTARLPAMTIAYVADSVRDAEALTQAIDAPVFVRHAAIVSTNSQSPIPDWAMWKRYFP